MKPIQIALIAVLANLLVLFGVLALANMQHPDHLANINWFAFAPIDLLYAVLVATVGWLAGSLLNGLLVYPKRRIRNYTNSQVNIGILCLLLILYFSYATGSFGNDNTGMKRTNGYVDIGRTWSNGELYRDVVNHGFKAF